MADFYDVHRKALEAARGRVNLGGWWAVSLREPLTLTTPQTHVDAINVVHFIAASDGTLRPATEQDIADIADWNRRHRLTPLSHFGLPDGLRG